MSEAPKKVYTLEENVKYISFGIKDLVKQLEQINFTLQSLFEQKSMDTNNPPF